MYASVALGAATISISEDDGFVRIPIIRTGNLQDTIVVNFATYSATADRDFDYIARSGSVVIGPGVQQITVPIQIIDNRAAEKTETFVFSITSVENAVLEAPRTMRVTIIDDETPNNEPPAPLPASKYDVTETTVIKGLDGPLDLEFSPVNEKLAYIAEKAGYIKVYNINTGQFVSTFLDISEKVNSYQDRGLMDIALDPNFAENPYIYAFYVVDPPDTLGETGNAGQDGGGNRFSYVVRYTADRSTGFTTVVPGSEKILLGGGGRSLSDISGEGRIDSTEDLTAEDSSVLSRSDAGVLYKSDYLKVDSRSHAGGSLAFGPDGALYVSVGDGTSYNAVDPRSVSVQSLDCLSGKILRIDPATGHGMADNPFVDLDTPLDGNRAKVYQLGLRNPFSIGFDQEGRLFISDTGWYSFEEINTGPAGANFGWPYYEGGDRGASHRTPGYMNLAEARAFYQSVEDGTIGLTAAFRSFSHNEAAPGHQVQAITAGEVGHLGPRYPKDLQQNYFFSDYAQGEVYTIDLNNKSDVRLLYRNPDGYGPVSFVSGPDGFLYYVDVRDGKVGRLLIETDNHLAGTRGADRMHGGRGDDAYIVNHAADRVIEADGQGLDVVRASVSFSIAGQSVEKLRLLGSDDINATGNSLSNRIIGNAGDNVLTGKLGRDVLTGGGGADTFVFETARDSAATPGRHDVIRDFRPGQGDEIDLRAIDADSRSAGNQSFHSIGGQALGSDAGELQVRLTAAGNTIVNGDTNGDGRIDLRIVLLGQMHLQAGDLIL